MVNKPRGIQPDTCMILQTIAGKVNNTSNDINILNESIIRACFDLADARYFDYSAFRHFGPGLPGTQGPDIDKEKAARSSKWQEYFKHFRAGKAADRKLMEAFQDEF